ncbi:MAG: response regulator transcription factor [Acidobacteriaceae bacterium]
MVRPVDLNRILIVDDELQITRVLKTTLSSRGYEVRTETNAFDALTTFSLWHPDLIITDLAMPNMTGVELCREVRTVAETPIIVLSVRSQERTKIEALDAGADDYVTKPFSIQELEARVRAHLRRAASTQPQLPGEPIAQGDFVIDISEHRVLVRGEAVHLTPKQFDLLAYFALHPARVLTHRVLLNAVWGGNAVGQPEYLRVAIGQLRKKIEVDDTPRYIRTEPAVGYRFTPEGLASSSL